MNITTGRRSVRCRKPLTGLLALTLIAALTFVSGGPAGAQGKVTLGDNASYSDGSPASGVKVDLFNAADSFTRGSFLTSVTTDGSGKYGFAVDPGCFFVVFIAPFGATFRAAGPEVVYDQQYHCVENDKLDADTVLYRADTKPPPTTAPPTTHPPTTAPPTTQPPATVPPTTAPPTTSPPRKSDWDCSTSLNKRTTFGSTTIFQRGLAKSGHINFQEPESITNPFFPGKNFVHDAGYIYRGISQSGHYKYYKAKVSKHPRLWVRGAPEWYYGIDYNVIDAIRSGHDLFTITYPDKTTEIVKCDIRKISPIGLDIDGSGSVERIAGEFALDFDGDGSLDTVSEWFAPTEGILVNGLAVGAADGVGTEITGKHLFGDQGGLYADGFEKLGLLDADSDGLVSGDELRGLRIWTDINSNARLDSGELSELGDHQIAALSTSHTNFVSEATLADGSTMMTEDLWFPVGDGAASTNRIDLRLLALLGIGLIGYAAISARRQRHNLDEELARLLDQADAK